MKVRAESAEEHGRLLEAQAKLDDLREQYSQLQRQNVVLVQSVGEQIMV